MKNIDLKNISSGTIARTLFLLVSLINGTAGIFGFTSLDIDENTIYTVVTGISTIVSAVIAFWKNNSFTKAAIEADNLKDALKCGDGITGIPLELEEIETIEDISKEML